MAQAPLPPAPDSSKCPGVQESVAKILFARRWVAAYGVFEVEEVFLGFFLWGNLGAHNVFNKENTFKTKKSRIIFWGLFSFGVTLQNTTFSRRKKPSKPNGNRILFTTSARRRHIALSSSSVTIISALVSSVQLCRPEDLFHRLRLCASVAGHKKLLEASRKRAQTKPTSTQNRPQIDPKSALGACWGDFWAVLMHPETIWGRFWASGTPLEASWGRPGAIWGLPGRPWRRPGAVPG